MTQHFRAGQHLGANLIDDVMPNGRIALRAPGEGIRDRGRISTIAHRDHAIAAPLSERSVAQPLDRALVRMTKIATATAATRLAAAGLVDLDADIDTYLRGYEGGRYEAPTVRQLLSHTAGLANPLPMRWVRPTASPRTLA